MGLIPFLYTWAYFYGNITSLHNFPSVGIWKSTYFINPYHHDLPQLKKKFPFPRHTLSLVRPYTDTHMHIFRACLRVPTHIYFLLNYVLNANCRGFCQFTLRSYMGLPRGKDGNFDYACQFLSISHFHVAEMIISRAMLVLSLRVVLRNWLLFKLP